MLQREHNFERALSVDGEPGTPFIGKPPKGNESWQLATSTYAMVHVHDATVEAAISVTPEESMTCARCNGSLVCAGSPQMIRPARFSAQGLPVPKECLLQAALRSRPSYNPSWKMQNRCRTTSGVLRHARLFDTVPGRLHGERPTKCWKFCAALAYLRQRRTAQQRSAWNEPVSHV